MIYRIMQKIFKQQHKKIRNSILFLLPCLLVLIVFTLIPLGLAFYMSFQGGRGSNTTFVGLENYIRVTSDEYIIKAVINNILAIVVLIPIVLFLSLTLANAINQIRFPKIKSIVSTILFFPSITSPVAYAYFFKTSVTGDGFLNQMFSSVSLSDQNILSDPWGARIVIALVCIWAWTGYYAMLFLSSLQNADMALYKSAKIDGAGNIRIFFRVTIPLLKQIIIFSIIMLFSTAFQLFAEVSIISKGGPNGATITLSYYMYMLCFQFVPQYGYAITIGLLIFIVCAIVGAIQIQLGLKR